MRGLDYPSCAPRGTVQCPECAATSDALTVDERRRCLRLPAGPPCGLCGGRGVVAEAASDAYKQGGGEVGAHWRRRLAADEEQRQKIRAAIQTAQAAARRFGWEGE